jgi:3-hydroxyisobutyrate dehydrogenase/glyoxylate/succinic semialdehyde reductase
MADAKTKHVVGVVGLGAMGSSLAERLLSVGYDLVVFNRSKEKSEKLAANGAWIAETPVELAKDCDVILVCVTDGSAVRELMVGSGAFSGAKPGTIFVDCSTISVAATRELSNEAAKHGLEWLDAPILGNPTMSRNGEQSFVVGGNKEALEEARPILEDIGKKIAYMGRTGLGQAAKLVHNITCGIALVAYSEALVLGEKLGLSREQTLEVLANGATASTLLSIKTLKFKDNIYEPTMAPLINMRKDLTLATDSAHELDIELPETSTAKKLFDIAYDQGLGRQDTSSVIKVLRN